MLIEPRLLGRRTLGEKQDVGLYAGVGAEHTIGQADDSVQVTLLDQALLERRLDAFAEEKSHRAAPPPRDRHASTA